jgi:hypothetical protein
MKKIGIGIGLCLLGFGALLFAESKHTREMASVEEAKPAEVADVAQKSCVHEFQAGESLWFIAGVYYAKGSKFTQIVEANKLQGTGGLKEGQKLVIPDPKWCNTDAGFKARYQAKWDEREKVLAAKKTAQMGKNSDSSEKPEYHQQAEIQKPEQKVSRASHVKVAGAHTTSEELLGKSEVVVVPIPASPIFRADGTSGDMKDESARARTATEAPTK